MAETKQTGTRHRALAQIAFTEAEEINRSEISRTEKEGEKLGAKTKALQNQIAKNTTSDSTITEVGLLDGITKPVKSWWLLWSFAFEKEIDGLPAIPIKGRGHGERILVNKKNPFTNRLRTEKITRRERETHDWLAGRYALKRDYDLMRDALLSIGVDMDKAAVIDPRAEKAAWVYWRMNKEIYPHEIAKKITARVKRNLARRQAREIGKVLRSTFQLT